MQGITLTLKRALKKIPNQPLTITFKTVPKKVNTKVYEEPYKMSKKSPRNLKLI
jgi:hypothetical protein